MMRMICLIVALACACHCAVAAEIRADVVDGKQFITVDGDFVLGDDRAFKNLAIEYDDAVVMLNSRGGLAKIGMEIGRTISIKGFATAVGANGMCASSCALAWLAGSERFMHPKSRVGFHAIYLLPDGKPVISSDGNALVGSYLRQLRLSDKIVVYVTQTAPESIQWLTPSDAVRLGLAVTVIPDDPVKVTSQAAQTTWSVPIPEQRPITQPVMSEEKAFLYEELLGQASPLAVSGTVKWERRQIRTPSGLLEDYIDGRYEMATRNMIVRILIGPNDDPTLHASHLVRIEVEYDGAADHEIVASVQRIAMKQTEQDRGNPLIGIAARMSEGEFLFAMSDDGDAEKVNDELLRSRSWIDIPVTYRSGRRALMTMAKGASGVEVFREVVEEWGKRPSAK